MTTQTVNFVLYFQTTPYRREKKINFHTSRWFPGLFFPQCKHVQNPVLKSPTSSSFSRSLPCAVPVPSASSMLWQIQPLTASFLPKPFTLWPSLPLPVLPQAAERRLALESILTCYIPVAQCFLMVVPKTPVAINQCAAQVHNCRFGEPNIFYRGCCLREVVPVLQPMFLWPITLPTKNKHSDVLATAEVKGKTTTFWGCRFKPGNPVTK